MGRGYENLAAGIGSTKKSSISSIITVSNSPRGSALLGYLELPMLLVIGRLRTITYVAVRVWKPVQAG